MVYEMLREVGVQLHMMKLKGDRNVPACQLSLLADLATWRNGPPDWDRISLPLCASSPCECTG